MSLLREGGVAKEWPKVTGEGWGFCQKVTQNDDQCSKKYRREREDKPKSEIWRGCGQKVKIEKQKFVQISASNFDKKTIVWVCNLNSPHCTSVHRAIQPTTYYAKCNVICGQYPYQRWKWIVRSSYRGIRDLAEGAKLYDLKPHHNKAGYKTQIRSYIT